MTIPLSYGILITESGGKIINRYYIFGFVVSIILIYILDKNIIMNEKKFTDYKINLSKSKEMDDAELAYKIAINHFNNCNLDTFEYANAEFTSARLRIDTIRKG